MADIEKEVDKILVDGPTYRKRIIELAEQFLIVVPCKKCNSPTNKGYVCTFCGCDDSQGDS